MKSDIDRFLQYVDQRGPDECWPWIGYARQDKYGDKRGRFGFRGTVWHAARVAFTLFRGEIPEGMHVCHKCDFGLCMNPWHFFLGTNADNVADKTAKGRASKPWRKTHCPKGHEYTAENTYVQMRRGWPMRSCRTCRNNWRKK